MNYPPNPPEPNWFEKQFRDISIFGLIFLPLCCSPIALALSLIAVIITEDPKTRANAKFILIVSSVTALVWLVFSFLVSGPEMQMQGG